MLLLDPRFLICDRYLLCASLIMSIKKFHESYYVQVESITSGRASSGGIRQAIAAVGVVVLFPPPYSPDLNPIEKLFSKLKTFLRKAATGSTDELWK